MALDENAVIRTIVLGSDWQEVLATLVVDEEMDPLGLDIVRLAAAFTNYLQRMKSFDFRIPARFILIAAILLRMKAELMLDEEEQAAEAQQSPAPVISIEDVPALSPPMERRPVRKVTLEELIGALNKAMAFRERKESKELRMRKAVETLIEPEEDIEVRIQAIMSRILAFGRQISFSELVASRQRMAIVDTFLPLLYLVQRGSVECEQEEFFTEIFITARASDEGNTADNAGGGMTGKDLDSGKEKTER